MGQPPKVRRSTGDDWWDEPVFMSGSAHAVSGDAQDAPPSLWVPDADRGGFKQHMIVPVKPKLGFR